MVTADSQQRPLQQERTSPAVELEQHREAIAVINEVCRRVGAGDLEARVPHLDGPETLVQARWSVNQLIDVADAFVREASASLTAASQGRFHRQFLTRGMPGAFSASAQVINQARDSMGQIFGVAHEAAEKVAVASTELSASASTLAQSARSGVEEVDGALDTVRSLEAASQEIQAAVVLIQKVAAQTKLLAFNAAIESARAGDAGRGFAIVADEVKSLADATAGSSQDIIQQIERTQRAAGDAVDAISRIAEIIKGMGLQTEGIATAAGGSGSLGDEGLSELSEHLRARLSAFVGSGS